MEFNLPDNIASEDEARQLAIDYQQFASETNLSYSELADYSAYFRDLGERFGLLDEFAENGII